MPPLPFSFPFQCRIPYSSFSSLLTLTLLSCAAAPTPTPKHPQHVTSRADLDRFLADEQTTLVLLAAADPRVAARGITVDPAAFHHAAMGGIIAEDPSLAVEPGKARRPDVLSFEVRERALAKAAEIVGKWTDAPVDPDPTSTLRPDIEIELLKRTLTLEKLRLENERGLPHSASVLLGGLATTWQALDLKDVSSRDDWLSKRLDEVDTSLTPQSLTVLERDELDDALDPLERLIAEALPKSRQALVRLRIGVQNVETAPHAADHWAAVAQRLYAATGTLLSAETLLGLIKAQSNVAVTELGQLVVKVDDASATRAGQVVLDPPAACHATHEKKGASVPMGGSAPQTPEHSLRSLGSLRSAPQASELRGLEPPPERAFDCALRGRMIASRNADEVRDLLVGMQDTLIAASWAIILARGGDAAAIALAAPKPVSPMEPLIEGKLMRFAATRPVEAITRALSIEWLMRHGLLEAAPRAEAWEAFGDAPLDIIDREVHTERRGPSLVEKPAQGSLTEPR